MPAARKTTKIERGGGSPRPLLIDPFGNLPVTPTRTSAGSWLYKGSGWVSRLFETEREAQHWFSTRGGVPPGFGPKGAALPVPKVAEATLKSAAPKEPLTIDPFSGDELHPVEVIGTRFAVPHWRYVGAGWQSKAFQTKEGALFWFSRRFGVAPAFSIASVVVTRAEGEVPRAVADAEVMEGLDLPGAGADA